MSHSIIQTTAVSSHDEWALLQRQCKAFIASGFLPEHITRGVAPEEAMAKAITIAVKGRELGIPPLQAFSSIAVIRGKPCLSSELMLALIYQRVRGAKVTFRTPPEKQASECTVEMQRPGGEPMLFKFTLQDAKTAGIVTSGGAWQKYPAAMLRARAVSAGARAVFPDCIMGCYTPEELGAPEILDIEAEDVEQKPPPPQSVAPPMKWMPGVEPKSTIESYLSNLKSVKGAEAVISAQIALYRDCGKNEWADQLERAAIDSGVIRDATSTAPEIAEDELFPFEK